MIVSASMGPSKAYSTENAKSFMYRRDEDGKNWKAISNGLLETNETTISVLVSNPKIGGEFYAVNNRGVFFSRFRYLVEKIGNPMA